MNFLFLKEGNSFWKTRTSSPIMVFAGSDHFFPGGSAFPFPIVAGARLSGKLNNNWRVGFLNMQTKTGEEVDDDEVTPIPAHNFTVATIQRQVFGQSSISVVALNKQEFDFYKTDSTEAFSGNNNQYNRLIGIDYNLRSRTNRWIGKFFLHKTFSPELKGDDLGHGVFLRYNTRNLRLEWNHEWGRGKLQCRSEASSQEVAISGSNPVSVTGFILKNLKSINTNLSLNMINFGIVKALPPTEW